MPPNGLELSCPAARATAHSFSRILAGKASQTFRTPAGSAAASCSAALSLRTSRTVKSPRLRLVAVLSSTPEIGPKQCLEVQDVDDPV